MMESYSELRKKLDVERNIRVTNGYIEKAKADMPDLPGTTPAAMGPVLKEIFEKLSEPSAKALYDVLKLASIAVGILKFDSPAEGSAEAQLDALAKTRAEEIRKSADGASLSQQVRYAVAYSEVIKEHPELYFQHHLECLN